MPIVVGLGHEYHLTLCAVELYAGLRLLSFHTNTTFSDMATWLCRMCLCIFKAFELIVAQITGILVIIHEVVSNVVS